MMERELGEGYSFTKKKCFVCGSLSHLIKDCDYYEKKMAREAAPKKQRVFNTGNRVTKPVWNNADRINHANHFVPRSVILNSGRPNVNSVRPNVNTVRTNINSVRQNVNSVWSNVNNGSFNVNFVRPKQPVPTKDPLQKYSTKSHSYAVKGNWGSVCLRPQQDKKLIVTQPQPSSTVVHRKPTTQPIPSEATTIPPLSQPAPPTPIAKTTTASPSPSPSPAHEPMEHTFEQPSTDQQPPTPRQEATTSQVKTLEVALKRKTKRVLLSDSEEEETEAQGRKTHDLDPLVSLVQELVTPSKTVNASGEEQVEDISPTTLEAAAILTKVQKIKSVDKGKRYKRRKSSKAFAGTGLDFEEVKSAFEKVNTGGIRVSVPSPDRGRREGKAPMTEEEETQASRKTKEQILQEEAGLAEAIRLDALEKALKKEEVAKQVRFGFTYKLKGC
ncbi:hypothetical protein Tco_1466799 [Tanacetum coccineum]